MAAVKTAKKELRRHIKKVLSDVTSTAAREQSQRVVKTLLSLPEYKAAKRISVYMSMPKGEVSTIDIVKDALASAKEVFIPYTHEVAQPVEGEPVSTMDMLALHSLEDYESLQSDRWGIPTPSRDSIAERVNCLGGHGTSSGHGTSEGNGGRTGLDLIVLPGMAFDTELRRLGHGKGYYDHFLTRICASMSRAGMTRRPFLVGLALTEQLLSRDEIVPTTSQDWQLDALIVGDGSLLRSASD
ncbi:hypothetical protein LTR50_002401 [Elasticomyces elasticus]|nr:hypothetical protein LTR50_002401 [Elasticomyces elasticus]